MRAAAHTDTKHAVPCRGSEEMSLPSARRGGPRRARRTEKNVRIRLDASQHERWSELKMRRALQTDTDVARYLLDLADVADQSVVPSCAPTTSTPELMRQTGSRRTSTQGVLHVVQQPRRLNPEFDISEIAESSHSERSKSMLSMSVPHLLQEPYDEEEEDETYYPESDSESETYSSSEDETFIQSAVAFLNNSGSEQNSPSTSSDEHLTSESDTDEELPASLHASSRFQTSSSPAFSVGCEKVIVSVAQLLQLLPSHCFDDKCGATLSTQQLYKGGVLILRFSCSAGHIHTWHSSTECIRDGGNHIYTNNILLAAACIFSGNSFEKLKQLFKFMGLVTITNRTFYRYQSALILPVVEEFWDEHMREVHTQLQGHDSILVSGDGRCDSPGSSAKYCTYTLMESSTKQIVHSQTVTRDMVNYQSPNMEREALRRSLEYLSGKVNIRELVTDASTSIIGMMSRDFCHIYHSLDVWHKAKKLRKALHEASKTKGMAILHDWSDNIVNHFWWCCEHCDADVETLKNKWISVLHHVSNEHEWTTGKCDHGTLTEPPKNQDGNVIQYIDKEDPAFQSLQKIVLDQRWLQSMKYYIRSRHTGLLESYHNLILAYIPKRFAHGDESYTARVHLAALDHNYHCNVDTKKSHDGTPQMRRVWRKRTKRWVAIPVKEEKPFDYVPKLMVRVLQTYSEQVQSLRAVRGKRRQVKITPVSPPPTSMLVAQKKSRFSSDDPTPTK